MRPQTKATYERLLRRVGIEDPYFLAECHAVARDLPSRAARVVVDRIHRPEARIARYLETHPTAKLHLGCGSNLLPGWLNSDMYPRTSAAVRLDATKPFPLEGDSFDYVFTEHMIEHLTIAQAQRMLREAARVLKRGGTIRVSTPDLAFLVGLGGETLTRRQDDYVAWAIATSTPDAHAQDPAYVINNFVKDWGHRFIYNRSTLTTVLEAAGLSDVRALPVGESDDEHLRGLENDGRMPAGFLELESMVLEARRR